MNKVYPHYPKPSKDKVSSIMTLFKKKRSWLDRLYERSYTMRMGEVKMPGATLYIPNEPSLIRRVLVSEAQLFPKNPLLHEVLEPLLGESIFTTNGRVWKRQRELLNPSFEMVRVEHVFDLMLAASTDMVKRLKKNSNNGYFDIDREMTFTTADIIFRTILSTKLDPHKGQEVVKAFINYQEASARIGMQKLFKVPSIFRKRIVQEYKKSGRIIRSTLSEIIEPRYKKFHHGKEQDVEYKDILSTLLKAKDPETGEPFSFKEILDQVAMLFLAGHETTASSMSWTLYILGLYPEYQERAREEVESIASDGIFSLEDIKRMNYVSSIFKESLRLYPPVSFMARISAEDTMMRDKKVSKGSYVVVSPWLMHRNARYWDDPHMFRPERFQEEHPIEKYTYFPFGMGPRICIGAAFAMQEAVLLLASILYHFNLELEPGFVPDIAGRLTTRSLNGIRVKLTQRI